MNRSKNVMSLRWLATRAMVVAVIVWSIAIVMVKTMDPADASTPQCQHEDSRRCLYDSNHPSGIDFAPIHFWINVNGKVWRLPHHIAHHLLYGSERTYRPCLTDGEDYGPCVWRADVRGNGEGRSYFLSRRGGVWYLPHHIARDLVMHQVLAGRTPA